MLTYRLQDPPAIIQVSRATRTLAGASFYSNTAFHMVNLDLLGFWLDGLEHTDFFKHLKKVTINVQTLQANQVQWLGEVL